MSAMKNPREVSFEGYPGASEEDISLTPKSYTTPLQSPKSSPSGTVKHARSLDSFVRFSIRQEGDDDIPGLAAKDIDLVTDSHSRRTSWITNEDSPWEGQYVLSLDGGGIRSYSTLLILKALMDKVEELEKRRDPEVNSSAWPLRLNNYRTTEDDPNPHLHAESMYLPHHYFDYIGGTSTGGLIAIMLGRLRMSVDAALTAFKDLGPQIFANTRWFDFPFRQRKRREEILIKYFKRLSDSRHNQQWGAGSPKPIFSAATRSPTATGDNILGLDEPFPSNSAMCRSVVFSACNIKDAISYPFVFRTYEHIDTKQRERNPGPAHNLPIWEIARATSAAPTFFNPMRINDVEYYDGSLALNNPSMEMFREVLTMNNNSPDSIEMMCSIGSGKKKDPPKSTSFFPTISAAMLRLSDISETNQQLQEIALTNKFDYYRLNIEDIGDVPFLPGKVSAGTLTLIEKKTEAYLETPAIRERVEECANMLVKSRHRRVQTARWELFALGLRYHCPMTGCESGQKIRNTRRDLLDHLRRKHNVAPLADAENYNATQELLDSGRIRV
ncbi:hypothetical protein MMC11_007593 [Xylographa trunciseda]|nr:hypothetical protein [Xylographa trunciseda]